MFEEIIRNGIIEPWQLHGLLNSADAPCIKIIDATFVMPGQGDAYAGYLEKHIDKAVFFDIEKISDHTSSLPHMLPSVVEFEQAMGDLGLSNEDMIVIYGQSGMVMGPARAWWTFRVFGHDKVCVLNGGLPAWVAEAYPVINGQPSKLPHTQFKAIYRPELIKSLDQVQNVTNSTNTAILDARPAARFAGSAPEPRPGMRSGHIPGSFSLPSLDLVDSSGKLRSRDELSKLAEKAGLKGQSQVIASCGSGVTACVIALALHHLGHKGVSVYDGSWAEWGFEQSNTKVSTL